MLGIRPEVLANASPKLLQRMGFQAGPGYGITEGYGAYSTGRPGDPNGALVHIRKAIDEGRYVRVGELTVDDARRLDPDTFTLQRLQGELGENRTASAGAERERVVGASASD